jgi:biopolymer transport protein ExbD
MAVRKIIPRTHLSRGAPDVSLAIVNIVLLLIFFFLVTGQMTTVQGFTVEISETTELPVEHLPQPILIFENDGSLTLNEDPVDEAALAAAVADFEVLHLLIDRNETADTLIDLLARPAFDHLEMRLVTVHRSGGS